MALQEELQALICQLEQLGYQPYQIRQIIEEAVGTMHWDRVSPASQQELVEKLESHIGFAIRCRKIK
jgi:lipase chaperone LimK